MTARLWYRGSGGCIVCVLFLDCGVRQDIHFMHVLYLFIGVATEPVPVPNVLP